MKYYPRRLTCIELLEARGFTHTGPGIGWEKRITLPGREGKYDRFHAMTHYGHIDLHFDNEVDGKRHEIKARSWRVRQEIEEIAKLDFNAWDALIDHLCGIFTGKHGKT